jgi:tRNA pseudouridine13 synthase
LDSERTLTARTLYDEGRFKEAAAAWPRGFREAEVVAKGMDRYRGDAMRALFSLDRKMLGFYVSAYQSRVFNTVLSARLQEMDTVEKGDVAMKQENGAMFLVEDEPAEKRRAERFEISATGPMFGTKMKQPMHRILRLEEDISTAEGGAVSLLTETRRRGLRCRGGRRPLREKMALADVGCGTDERGHYLRISFSLSAGSYATAVLREVFKNGLTLSDGSRSSGKGENKYL